jgi:tRNA pseudouridine55 synthase
VTGVLLVDKPVGITSAAVIRRLKRRLGRRTKVGHVGTLDPFASGLLPLCVGEATKIARYLTGESKAYEGTIALGATTDTLDPTGTVVESAPVPPFGEGELAAVERRLTGVLEQEPPMYSAVKREGVPLYRLARRGCDVAREPRRVRVSSLSLRRSGPEELEVRVQCSKGTYVRVLAADVGRALGTVGHLTRLRRVAVGALTVDRASTLEALEGAGDEAPLPLLPIADALGGFRRETVSAEELDRLRRGQQGPLGRLAAAAPGTLALLVDGTGTVAGGIVESDAAGRWRVVRLLNPDPAPNLYMPEG